jgi:hypothetical protein
MFGTTSIIDFGWHCHVIVASVCRIHALQKQPQSWWRRRRRRRQQWEDATTSTTRHRSILLSSVYVDCLEGTVVVMFVSRQTLQ